jgi:hypothetical protein
MNGHAELRFSTLTCKVHRMEVTRPGDPKTSSE